MGAKPETRKKLGRMCTQGVNGEEEGRQWTGQESQQSGYTVSARGPLTTGATKPSEFVPNELKAHGRLLGSYGEDGFCRHVACVASHGQRHGVERRHELLGYSGARINGGGIKREPI